MVFAMVMMRGFLDPDPQRTTRVSSGRMGSSRVPDANARVPTTAGVLRCPQSRVGDGLKL